MAGETLTTIVGHLTADPELRFTPSGAAVANFTIASTPRHFDSQANQWKDGTTLFMRCSQWREPGENVAESLAKGTRVIAQGFLGQRDWETREGEKRVSIELNVQEIGPTLRYATAKVTPTARRDQGQGQQQRGGGQQSPGQSAAAANPWGTAPSADEPPFS